MQQGIRAIGSKIISGKGQKGESASGQRSWNAKVQKRRSAKVHKGKSAIGQTATRQVRKCARNSAFPLFGEIPL